MLETWEAAVGLILPSRDDNVDQPIENAKFLYARPINAKKQTVGADSLLSQREAVGSEEKVPAPILFGQRDAAPLRAKVPAPLLLLLITQKIVRL